jgi:integrase/recombinase XerD
VSVAAGQTAPAGSHGVGFDLELVLGDLRHMEARAASDLADWLVHLDLEGKADRTIYGYSRYGAQLLRMYPDKTLAEITHSDLNELLRVTPTGLPAHRPVGAQRVLRVGTVGRPDRPEPRRPVPKMRHPKRRPKDIFSESEVGLLEGLPSPDGPLWALLFGSGIRRGEARRLRRQHVDLNRERLMVYQGKGGKDRIVPIPVGVLQAVADLDLFEGLRPADHLWYSRRGDRRMRRDPIGDSTFERWYRKGIEAAGVRYLNPHQTRHTYGNVLRELGFTLEDRQLLMGHEDIATTNRYYGHLTIEDVALKMKAKGL